jgi:hypothetical protein
LHCGCLLPHPLLQVIALLLKLCGSPGRLSGPHALELHL